jgi:hypothetical protein
MGSEVVSIYIGQGKRKFTVHKKLLLGAGQIFSDMFPVGRKATERVTLGKEEPEIFKLFVEYLYTKIIPRLHNGISVDANAQRIRDLCQLYAFLDKFQLDVKICNKVMDTIQDGFYFLDTLPDTDLITVIYEHTAPTSKLRRFCTATLVFGLRMQHGTVKEDMLVALLSGNKDILRDFARSIVDMEDLDPRIRDCGGDLNCTECLPDPDRVKDKPVGSWPCKYHIQNSPQIKSEDASGERVVSHEEICYLWKI